MLTVTNPTPQEKQILTAAKPTPQEKQITAALNTALKKINTTTTTNITTLNKLVSTAQVSATNADTSAKIASAEAASLTAMVTTINDLVSKMDLANVDIDKLQVVCNNLQTVSGMHSNDLYLLNSSIDILFKFFFHRASSSGIVLDTSNFKIVDTATKTFIPTYLSDHVTYVP
jgi:hypothetical protein